MKYTRQITKVKSQKEKVKWQKWEPDNLNPFKKTQYAGTVAEILNPLIRQPADTVSV